MTELNEQRARELLTLAADTVDVVPAGPIDTTGVRPRWPVIVAAAAVAVLVAGVGIAVGVDRDDSRTAPADDPTSVPTVDASLLTLPTVLGLDRVEAARLLAERGLEVSVVEREPTCGQPGGMALGTDPVPGSAIHPGQSVRLDITGPAPARESITIPCARQQSSWELVRLARGISDGPTLAPEVTLVAGSVTATIARRALADPAAWEVCGPDGCFSALADLAGRLEQSQVVIGNTVPRYRYPTVSIVDGFQLCPWSREQDAPLVDIQVLFPLDGPRTCGSVALTFDDTGAVSRVEVSTTLAPPDAFDVPVPSADFPTFARGGPAPSFADEVHLYANGGASKTLSGADAIRRDAWDAAAPGLLAAIAEADVIADPGCGRATRPALPAGGVWGISDLGVVDCTSTPRVVLLVDQQGRIHGVAANYTAASAEGDPGAADSVATRFLAFATGPTDGTTDIFTPELQVILNGEATGLTGPPATRDSWKAPCGDTANCRPPDWLDFIGEQGVSLERAQYCAGPPGSPTAPLLAPGSHVEVLWRGCSFVVILGVDPGGLVASVQLDSESPGTDPVPLPDVTGLDQDEATEVLLAAGFGVSAREVDTPQCYDDGLVIGQDPVAGTVATPGSTVSIRVNRELEDPAFCGGDPVAPTE